MSKIKRLEEELKLTKEAFESKEAAWKATVSLVKMSVYKF